jgi:hypothetical protein
VKVAELITKLQAMPPGAEVDMEGCDCIGRAEGVRLDGYEVLITRTMDEADRARRGLLYPLFDDDPIEVVEVEEAVSD